MPAAETAFTALRIEGGLLPPEFLARVAALEAEEQRPSDYSVPPGRTLRDEIGRYWSIAEALWAEYRQQRQRADVVQFKVGVERWLIRLLREVLGFSDLTQIHERTLIGERSFPITHRAHDGGFPLVLTTFDHDLDRSHSRFGEDSRRRSPHAALQEYVNAEPKALWGIVSNGVKLRVLRDNPSLTRPAFVEIDLERVFEEGLYADFTAFWLLVHASRSAPNVEGVVGQRWEKWRTEGTKVGQRALDNLRAGVTSALRELGSGFIEHPANEIFRASLRDGSLTPDDLHQQLLRLVYRLLFLFAAEDRDLLHPREADQEARELYAAGYSLSRLRERARFKRNYDGHGDLWSGLTVTFMGLARGAHPLGLPALGGLFDAEQCLDLDRASITNARILSAVHALAFFSTGGMLQRVNYRDMGAEELGSVYESLLELHPAIQVATRPWNFNFIGGEGGGSAKGNERKLSGSYYTPNTLVQELLRSALDPVIERTIHDNPQDPRGALLKLKIVDPACGSGHFLLGAARHMADALARLETESDLPDEILRRHALREVVRRCIYGVDRNPLSVELCKTALWIETIEPGKPLSFLDAHIKCGDSLVGVFDLEVLRNGIPDEAFKELTGDDKAYARALKKRNTAERDNPILGLLPEASLPPDLTDAAIALEAMSDDTVEAVEAKSLALREIETSANSYHLRIACDLWCAAFFLPKAQRPEYRGHDLVPTSDTIWRYLHDASLSYGPMIDAVAEVAARARFFHWPLAYPEVFAAGGFDVVLGNPPWERIKLQEPEFFAARHIEIAAAANTAVRRRLIEALRTGDPADRALHGAFEAAKRDTEAASQFVRGSGRFPLTAVGDVNTYALFSEAFLTLMRASGRAGFIVPTGIATDDSTKNYFDQIITQRRLIQLYDFQTGLGYFNNVGHARFKFCLLTIGAALKSNEKMNFAFFLRKPEDFLEEERFFNMTAEDIRLINPNTRNCPIFRSNADAELTKRIYRRVPVLINEEHGAAGNAWNIRLRRMFDKTNASAAGDLKASSEIGEGDEANWLPVHEGDYGHQFDHRYATFDGRMVRETKEQERADPSFEPGFELRARSTAYKAFLNRWEVPLGKSAMLAFRRVARSTDDRTVIAALLPQMPLTYGWIIVLDPKPEDQALLLANFNSLVFDYCLRSALSQPSIPQGVFQQTATLPPSAYGPDHKSFIVRRVLELTYSSEYLAPFARELGHDGSPFIWSEGRRAILRAELDALYAHLYGLTRDELRFILDPADIHGSGFPSESFRVLKEKEIRQHGEYRTARLVLAAWDQLSRDGIFAMRTAA